MIKLKIWMEKLWENMTVLGKRSKSQRKTFSSSNESDTKEEMALEKRGKPSFTTLKLDSFSQKIKKILLTYVNDSSKLFTFPFEVVKKMKSVFFLKKQPFEKQEKLTFSLVDGISTEQVQPVLQSITEQVKRRKKFRNKIPKVDQEVEEFLHNWFQYAVNNLKDYKDLLKELKDQFQGRNQLKGISVIKLRMICEENSKYQHSLSKKALKVFLKQYLEAIFRASKKLMRIYWIEEQFLSDDFVILAACSVERMECF